MIHFVILPTNTIYFTNHRLCFLWSNLGVYKLATSVLVNHESGFCKYSDKYISLSGIQKIAFSCRTRKEINEQ